MRTETSKAAGNTSWLTPFRSGNNLIAMLDLTIIGTHSVVDQAPVAFDPHT